MTKKAVLMLAYGTPANTERMRCYLSDIRGGRPMSDEFVAEFKHRYDLIGGSPLTALTYEQAKKNRPGIGSPRPQFARVSGHASLVAVD